MRFSRGSLPRKSGEELTAKSATLVLASSQVKVFPPGVPTSKASGKDHAPGREMLPWVAIDSTSTITRVQTCG